MQSDENDPTRFIEENRSDRFVFFLDLHNWLVASQPSSSCKSLSLIGYKVCVRDMEFIRDEYATQAWCYSSSSLLFTKTGWKTWVSQCREIKIRSTLMGNTAFVKTQKYLKSCILASTVRGHLGIKWGIWKAGREGYVLLRVLEMIN